MIKSYNIVPVQKPRMTRSDKWKGRNCVKRYFEFCNKVKAAGIEISYSKTSIVFALPMPKSWNKKKREEYNGKPHQQKPDLDNLLKALSDAVHKEDCKIWHYGNLSKVWAETGSITIVR